MEKTCLTCSEKLNGRADKKYCNEACKNEFHNRKFSRKAALETQQWSAARKNREILSKIEAKGIAEISSNELQKNGFDFEGLTGLKILGKGNFLLYCFDFRLVANGNNYKINKNPVR